MRFSLRTYIVDVRCCARCIARRDMVDVRPLARMYGQCVTGKPYFHQKSHSSRFPYFRVVLVELGLIEDFLQIWRTWIFQSIQRRFSIHVSFNSHNAHCYFPMHCTSILCIEKTYIFYNSHSLYLLHMNSVILKKNVVLNMLTK
jgi:hypothetical protein